MAKKQETPTFEQFLEQKVIESYTAKSYAEVQDIKARKKEYDELYPKEEVKTKEKEEVKDKK